MRRSAYLETTVIGYLAMRSSRDVRVAANQLSTREWWDDHRPEFDIFVSQFVIDECEQGDPSAASERRIYLNDIPVLDMNENVEALAEEIANELQNCKHIANPENRPKIERACRDRGIEPPLICTPFDLLEI